MNLKSKKFIPYYITGAIIVLFSVIIVFILSFSGCRTEVTPEITTSEPDTLFMNGSVPYYEDVAASSFSSDNFVFDENGRISYTDSDVNYYTGIDVSSHQGEIDWEKVAQDGIDFAIVRIGFRGYGSSGLILEDDMSEENIKNAYDAGLKVGVYFYSQAITPEEAKEEADFVLDIIKNYHIEYPVVFDWENDPATGGMRTDNLSGDILTQCAVSFCEEIKNAGYTPAVYFNLTDAYARYNLSVINKYPFWYAQHEGSAPLFYYNYLIWQYSDSGSVNGISGNVDLNISFSDFSNN